MDCLSNRSIASGLDLWSKRSQDNPVVLKAPYIQVWRYSIVLFFKVKVTIKMIQTAYVISGF